MKDFVANASIISYNTETIEESKPKNGEAIFLSNEGKVTWFNNYGLNYTKQFNEIITANKLDDFFQLLIVENKHRNKVIELEDSMFLAINTIHLTDSSVTTEQMMFIIGHDFVWSIQERSGDYFQEIRYRLRENKGIVRKKSSDYLLYLILDAIIDNYTQVYEKVTKNIASTRNFDNVDPSQEYVMYIESLKQQLFQLKKAISSLREAISKIENSEIESIETRYFTEVKEQANYLMDYVDFDLNQLESNLNLILNLQSNRLNQVMKTLTIFSVIFIPLTFLAGLYGMNFNYIPELELENGYFYFLGLMVVITLITVYLMSRKKWF